MTTQRVNLKDIDLENSPKVREELRQEVIAEYTELYKAKTLLMPPDVFRIPKSQFFIVGDGMHRITSAIQAGLTLLPCTVHDGGIDECYAFALKANITHGVRRSNGDKRACVETAMHRYVKYSNAQIADACGVSEPTVAKVRKLLEETGTIEESKIRVDAKGVSRPATGNKLAKDKSLDQRTGHIIKETLSKK